MGVVGSILLVASVGLGAGERPLEFPLSRFGVRATLDPCPQHGGIRFSVAGRPSGEVSRALVGLSITDSVWTLPLSKEGSPLVGLEQELTPTSTRLRGRTPAKTAEVTLTLRSPFYPGDPRLSTAPVFLVDVEVRNLGRRPRPGRLQLRLPFFEPDAEVERIEGFHGLRGKDPATQGEILLAWDDAVEGTRVDLRSGALVFESDLRLQQTRTYSFVLAFYHGAEVFRRGATPYRFRYTSYFGSANEAAAWALAHGESIRAKSDLFDSLVVETGAPPAARNLASLAFQTFCGETFWGVGPEGDDDEWFGVWDATEGRFHPLEALVFVSPWLAAVWPSLLDRLLAESSDANAPPLLFAPGLAPAPSAESVGFPSGSGIETALDAADWLVVVHEARDGGAEVGSTDLRDRILRAVRAIVRSDSDGDGIPDAGPLASGDPSLFPRLRGPGSPALGMRALVALRAAQRMLSEEPAEVREGIDRLRAAWPGGAAGMRSPAITGSYLPLERWGDEGVLPARDTIVREADTIERELGGRKGIRLRPGSPEILASWSLAHDLVAIRAGAESADRLDRAWSAQASRLRDPEVHSPGGWVDRLAPEAGLPSARGLLAFEIPAALADLRRVPPGALGYRAGVEALGIPLVWAADWEGGTIPWIRHRPGPTGTSTLVSHRALLGASFRIFESDEPGATDDAGVRLPEIRLDLPRGESPRLLEGRVLVEGRGGDGEAWEIRLRADDPIATCKLRATGLSPGRFDLRIDGKPVAEFDGSVAPGEGVVFPATGASALPVAMRADLLRLRDRVSRLAEAREEGVPARSVLVVGRAVEASLVRDLDARRFLLEVLQSDEAPTRSAEGMTEGERPREGAPPLDPLGELHEAVASLLAEADASGGAAAVGVVCRAIEPLELRFREERVTDEAREKRGTLQIVDRWLPALSGTVTLASEPGLVLDSPASFPLDGLAPGSSAAFDVRLRDAADPPRLHASLEARIAVSLAGRPIVLREPIPARRGEIRSWLVSRIYTTNAAGDFERSEGPERERRPEPGSGDAFWRPVEAPEGILEIGRLLGHSGRYCLYAHAYVLAPEATQIEITGRAAARVRIWVDGRALEVSEEATSGGSRFSAPLPLAAGWNGILLKLEEGDEGWQAVVRLATEDAALRAALRASALPPG